MSKVRKATTKKVAKSSTSRRALVELRAIVAGMAKLRAAADAAHAEYSKVEGRFFTACPPMPKATEMPDDLSAVFDQITVAQFRDMPQDHPYAIWQREHGAADKAAMAAYQAERARISKEHGVAAANAAASRADNALAAAERKAMKNTASGMEAIALKARALRLANYDLHAADFGPFFKSVEAIARAAGFNSKA